MKRSLWVCFVTLLSLFLISCSTNSNVSSSSKHPTSSPHAIPVMTMPIETGYSPAPLTVLGVYGIQLKLKLSEIKNVYSDFPDLANSNKRTLNNHDINFVAWRDFEWGFIDNSLSAISLLNGSTASGITIGSNIDSTYQLLGNVVASTPSDNGHERIFKSTSPNANWLIGLNTKNTIKSISLITPIIQENQINYINIPPGQRADFVSPSGRLLCFVTANALGCSGPNGAAVNPADKWQIPPLRADICSKQVIGMELSSKSNPTWICGNSPFVTPILNNPSFKPNVSWHKTTFGTVHSDVLSSDLAVLPYGYALKSGQYECVSRSAGVTCQNIASRQGWFINKDGIFPFPQSLPVISDVG